ADRNRSHWSTSKTPSYTKSVSWQHHPPSLSLSETSFSATERHADKPEAARHPAIYGKFHQ
ncbi:hypothetical protein K1J48_07165, partial [Enterobacter hormaechei]|uniref:hypothetical protein n=1 Tax=Enterobacter hormaechei TaxID=158836 RepID=UPI001C63D66B